jgi:uncharacterized protein YcbX
MAEVARAKTHYDVATGFLEARANGLETFAADLRHPAGKEAFARWLTPLLGEMASGRLQVVEGPGHRFLDHPQGHVSIINLASVRDLASRIGRDVDPLRFRANLYVDGWPAWAENSWTGRELTLGPVRTRVFKTITRCAAPEVDPVTAARDIPVTAHLHEHYGHLLCGIYVQVTKGGEVAEGDPAEVAT